MASTLAAIKTDIRQVQVREFELPEIDDNGALMRVEAAGMCGAFSYVTREGTGRSAPSPGMNAHENAGVLVKVGKAFQARHGVEEGELVTLEEYLPCGHCEWCRIGEFRHCWLTDTHNNANPSRLAGGFSQYLYLPPNAVIHKVPQTITPDEAALALPMGNGVQWACVEGEAGPGKTVVIQGPGSKGLGCTIAAKKFGASTVIVTGLAKDAARLDAAKRLGADHVIDVQSNDFVESIMDITDGRGADAVVDCTTGRSPVVFTQAIEVLVRRGGIVVTQSYELDSFSLSQLTGKYGQLRACRGHSYKSVATGLEWIASREFPLTELMTHHYPLELTGQACLASGGEADGQDAVWVMVNPWMGT
jgi:threonine dehydrogenase-like Zn-dependent dehydrogenase